MNSIEEGHICIPQILRLRIFSFVGGNPILEVDKGERFLFPYKRGPLPLDLKGGKKGQPWACSTKKKWETLMALN